MNTTSDRFAVGGSVEKKRALREMLESSPLRTDLSADAVPDTNVLTAVLKDYLRELPEPIIHNCIYELLVDAATVSLPNDRQGNTQLMLRALDCMSSICKVTKTTTIYSFLRSCNLNKLQSFSIDYSLILV